MYEQSHEYVLYCRKSNLCIWRETSGSGTAYSSRTRERRCCVELQETKFEFHLLLIKVLFIHGKHGVFRYCVWPLRLIKYGTDARLREPTAGQLAGHPACQR